MDSHWSTAERQTVFSEIEVLTSINHNDKTNMIESYENMQSQAAL